MNLYLIRNIPLNNFLDSSKCRLTICLQSRCHWAVTKHGILLHSLDSKYIYVGRTGTGENHCCIFQPAFGCSALQKLVKIFIFNIFCAIKHNFFKQEICRKIQQKTFLSGNKTLNQDFGAKLIFFFAKFCFKFVAFCIFLAFWCEKMLKMEISTRVSGTKRWLKNTTNDIKQRC